MKEFEPKLSQVIMNQGVRLNVSKVSSLKSAKYPNGEETAYENRASNIAFD
jgi:hypothetical protein